jgi:hypothetical protein
LQAELTQPSRETSIPSTAITKTKVWTATSGELVAAQRKLTIFGSVSASPRIFNVRLTPESRHVRSACS